MKVAVFSTQPYDRTFLEAANQRRQHELVFFEARLTHATTPLAAQSPAVCVFVNDVLDKRVLGALAEQGTRLIALRCTGFNNVDLPAARDMGLTVVRVPAYSPHAVAEHTVGLILALNRKIHRSHARVREGNLTLDGLLGFDLYGQTVGIIGTGRIGTIVARILKGFGCVLLAHDRLHNRECQANGVTYIPLSDLLARCDIISLHCPLMPETYHMIDTRAMDQMKTGAMLINTSRGALIDARAAIAGLKSGKIGYLGLDVYEEEADLFFRDLSDRIIQDDVFARLLTFPNVIITGHQAFFTRNALEHIAETTLSNIAAFERGEIPANEVTVDHVLG